MGKVSHITHLEAEFLESGKSGLHGSIDKLWRLKQIIEGKDSDGAILTTKYDAAPSIVCGICSKTGLFFVGTKAVFNKTTPKFCYTVADIMRHYPDRAELQETLRVCLLYLPQLGIKNVIQGDLMYVNLHAYFSSLKGPMHNGKLYIAFEPNTVTYGIPYFSDMANRIMNAKLGIIFHTQYDKDMNASPITSETMANLNYTKDVWFRDASFTMIEALPCPILDYLLDEYKRRIEELDTSVVNKFFVNKRINTLTNLFFNHIIRNGIHHDNGEEFVVGLNCFIHEQINKDVDAAQKIATKYRKLDEKNEIFHFLYTNHAILSEMFELILLITIEKHTIIDILNDNNSGIEPLDGHEHEGYVLALPNGDLTKLVNRRKFSAANFANNRWEN